MHTITIPAVLAAAGVFLATAFPAQAATKPPQQDVKAVVDANNAFATDLYAQFDGQPGNIFFSPLSISTAMAMTQAGAAGDTQTQFRQGLHLDRINPQGVAPAMGELSRMLRPSGERAAYQLSMANALWPQKGFALNQDYVRLIQSSYGGALTPLDFANPTSAAKAINEWVGGQTNDRIRDLISPDLLTKSTRLVLTDAVYFKGTWLVAFPERATKEEPFTTSSGVKAEVPMMHQTSRFFYAQAPSLQVLKMDYDGGDLSMVFLLPDHGSSLAALEKNISGDALGQWLGKLESHEVVVSLPRFRMTYGIVLNVALQRLGMVDAFDPDKADFSGMASQDRLFLGTAIHKAFIDVNEKGTEAAAATGAVMRPTAIAVPHEAPIVFRADHPFFFVIQHNQSGAILFMGRVANPKE